MRRGTYIRHTFGLDAASLRPWLPVHVQTHGHQHDQWASLGSGLQLWPTALQQIVYRGVRRGGYTYDGADRIAIQLGRHPSEIWGAAWFYRDDYALSMGSW